MDQPCKVANPARGRTGKTIISLSPFAPENLVSREKFGRPVPRQPVHSPHLKVNLVLPDGIHPAFRDGVPLLIWSTAIGPVPSCQVTQIRTNGVHCRQAAGAGPVVLNVVPVTGTCLFRYHHGPLFVHLSFPTPTIGTVDMYDMAITYNKGKDQPGKVAKLARGQLNRENDFFPVPVPA